MGEIGGAASAPRAGVLGVLDTLAGLKRVIVRANERAVLLRDGDVAGIVGPGELALSARTDSLEVHNLNRAEFVSQFDRVLFTRHAALAREHLTEFTTGPDEIGVIYRDKRIYALQKPDGRSALWTAAGPWSMEAVAVDDTLAVPTDLSRRLERFGPSDKVVQVRVEHGQAGLMFVDGAYARRLAPGQHMFWNIGRKIEVKRIDLRAQSIDVAGQEILTRDRVSIRVNLAAVYRVADPVAAATEVSDFSAALYRALQYAFRTTLGALTLDEILEQKIGVDAEAADGVRADMAAIGLEVGKIVMKDVILPGEMREILNQVVEAEKTAQANVIRRREETAATRSLLNTAKVMAENPIMLRLKELEALETIADKVDRLVIHNGARGLLDDLARLGPPDEPGEDP